MHRSRHGVIAALLAMLSCPDSAVLAQVYLEGRAGLSASRGEIDFDRTVSSTNATEEDFEKLSNELALGRESLGRSVATDAFVWLCRDVGLAQRWSAELGLGAGGSRSVCPSRTVVGQIKPSRIRHNVETKIKANQQFAWSHRLIVFSTGMEKPFCFDLLRYSLPFEPLSDSILSDGKSDNEILRRLPSGLCTRSATRRIIAFKARSRKWRSFGVNG